jgi:hypothetical protein
MKATCCLNCRWTSQCEEFVKVRKLGLNLLEEHTCKEFSGISEIEQGVRRNTIENFGLPVLVAALAEKSKGHTQMAYTSTELEKMKRYGLRKVAEEVGLSLAKSGDMDSKSIIEHVLQKQGGKKGATRVEKEEPKAAEPEEEGDAPETPSRAPAKAPTSPVAAPRAAEGDGRVLEAIGAALDAAEARRELAYAVLDRKLNIIMGAISAIGAATINEEFDPLEHEEHFLKEKKYGPKLRALEESSTLLVERDEQEGR